MEIVGAVLVVIVFAALLHVFRTVEFTKQVTQIAHGSVETIRSSELNDRQKESIVQKNTVQLLRLLGILVVTSIAALVLPLVLVWLLALAGLWSYDAVQAMLLSWEFIIAAAFIGVAAYYAIARLSPAPK